MRTPSTIAAVGRELLDTSNTKFVPANLVQLAELFVEFMESTAYQLDAAGITADTEADAPAA